VNGLPYYKAYPRDFVEGTIGMPFEMKCAYRVVLDLIYMQGGDLPDDPRYISGLLGCSVRKWNSIRDFLISAGKLQVNGEFLTNYRAVIELETLAKLQDRQRENRSGSNKNKGLEKPRSRQPEPEPEPDKELKRDTIVSPKKAPDQSFDLVPSEQIPKPAKNAKASRLPDDWALPRDWGDWAVSEGWDASDVRLEAEKFRDFWISKAGKDAAKLNWLATWRNWMRNSRTPKSTSINGGIYDQNTNKSDQRDRALADEILAAARAR
tara:strand:- start:6076 stop:6870 length:795 start_codon:yes stop_codon:yes gene_type:complete